MVADWVDIRFSLQDLGFRQPTVGASVNVMRTIRTLRITLWVATD